MLISPLAASVSVVFAAKVKVDRVDGIMLLNVVEWDALSLVPFADVIVGETDEVVNIDLDDAAEFFSCAVFVVDVKVDTIDGAKVPAVVECDVI